MDRLPDAIIKNLFPVLKKYSTTGHDLGANLTRERITTASIPDFQSLGPLMQEYCVPVYEIKREMTEAITDSGAPWGGATWTDAVRRMNGFKEKFEEIVQRIESF
jgi:hypothetical protein